MAVAVATRVRLYWLVVCLFLVVWICCPPMRVRAQATYFEVPSADVPERAQGIAQLQVSAGRELDIGATMAIGVGAGTEVGVTLYNLTFAREDGNFVLATNHADQQEPFAPIVMGTAQKLFGEGRELQFSLGGQAGTNLAGRDDLQFIARAYALLVLDLDERGRCTIGPYVASQELLADQQHFAAFMGCEVEAIPRRFGFEVEWDAGAGALGKISAGPRVHLGQWGALSVGAQIPNGWSTAPWRAVAQLEATFPGQQD